MALPLSILDLTPIRTGGSAAEAIHNSIDLARRAEALGFVRHWFAEHHNTSGLASASPEILIALVAAQTQRMKIGAGGIMLPNHSPLRVAEHFRTLHALYPGRTDLGLGRAPGTDQLTAVALRRTTDLGGEDFADRIQELQAYAGEAEFPEGLPFQSIIATPDNVPLPPLWLLSSSGFGGDLAAKLGRPFAFAHHFSPAAAKESMLSYRRNFRPSKHLEKPYAILTVAAICAETAERAEELARCVDLMWIRFRRNERGPLPSPEEARDYPYSAFEREQARASRAMLTVGTPEVVRAELMRLATEMEADELMISTHIPVHAERVRSYELIAEAMRA